MLIRLSGALLLTAAFSAAGMLQSDCLRRRADVCRSISDMLRKCEFLVSYQAMNVYEICAALKESAFVRELPFTASLPVVFEPQKSFSAQWDSALEKQGDMLPEEKELIHRLGQTLGSSDIPGQTGAIEALLAENDELYRRRQEEYLRRGRLCRSVGVLAGLMAGIMFI